MLIVDRFTAVVTSEMEELGFSGFRSNYGSPQLPVRTLCTSDRIFSIAVAAFIYTIIMYFVENIN